MIEAITVLVYSALLVIVLIGLFNSLKLRPSAGKKTSFWFLCLRSFLVWINGTLAVFLCSNLLIWIISLSLEVPL